MNRKAGFWIAVWVILAVVTGFLAFGYGSGGAPGWYGMGPGMMGSYGMGPGWSGGTSGMMPWLPQNLTEEQAKKASQMLGDADKANRKLIQQRWDAQVRLKELYAAEKRDWNAIRAASMAISELQGQELKAAIDMQQKIDELLTDSQRQEMTRAWRGYGWQGGQ